MLLRKCIATDFKILISVKDLVEPTRLINFGNIRLNVIGTSCRYQRRFSSSLDYKNFNNRNYFHSVRFPWALSKVSSFLNELMFNQLFCMLAQQKEEGLDVLTQPFRSLLRGCQSNKPVLGFCVPFYRDSAESRIKNPFLDSPKGTHPKTFFRSRPLPFKGWIVLSAAIRRINHYPANKSYQNLLSHPLDSDFPVDSGTTRPQISMGALQAKLKTTMKDAFLQMILYACISFKMRQKLH